MTMFMCLYLCVYLYIFLCVEIYKTFPCEQNEENENTASADLSYFGRFA